MDVKVFTDRLASKYVVITTLAGLERPGSSNQIPSYYSDIISELSPEEISALENFRMWHNKNFTSEVRLKFFTNASEKELLENLPDREMLQDVFNVLEKPFAQIWDATKDRLKQAKEAVELDFDNQINVLQQVLATLNNFFQPFNPAPPTLIKVFLVPYPPKTDTYGTHSGHCIGTDTIIFEVISLENPELLKRFWLLFIHEFVHASFETAEYKKWVRDFIKSQNIEIEKIDEILRETVINSLTPRGYLAEKYFGLDGGALVESSANSLKLHASQKLYPLAKDYIDNNRKIDENYLQQCLEVVVYFKKKVAD